MVNGVPPLARIVLLAVVGFVLGCGMQRWEEGNWFGFYSGLFAFVLACSGVSEMIYRRLYGRGPFQR